MKWINSKSRPKQCGFKSEQRCQWNTNYPDLYPCHPHFHRPLASSWSRARSSCSRPGRVGATSWPSAQKSDFDDERERDRGLLLSTPEKIKFEGTNYF